MTVRFGVAGTGYWAREVHLSALANMTGVELAGVWGRNGDAARDAARRFNIAAFSTFEEMLADVDAVSIAVPPAAQPTLAVTAASAGKHLLLEKPLALELSEARRVADAIAKQKVAAIVFFMRRFVPEIEAAVQEAATMAWKCAQVDVYSTALSTPSPYSRSAWRQASGAALWDIGPHVLSILLPVLGPVDHIEAIHHADRRTTFKTVHANGATGAVSVTLHSAKNQAVRRYRFFSARLCVELPEPDFSYQAALQSAAADLLACINEPDREHRCGIAMGTEVIRLLEAAERSTHRER